jgi:phosphoglycerate dehydrogenase-like enzyme
VIVLLEAVHADALALLASVDTVHVCPDPLVVDSDVPRDEVTVILTRGRGRLTASTYDEFPNLVVVGRCGVGLDNIDVAGARARGIAVVNVPGATTAAVAEHAVMLMLALARRVGALDAAVKAGRWSVRDSYLGTELSGKRLGVVGLGAIGGRVADLGRALGMDVTYWSPSSRSTEHRYADLDDLFGTADVVQLCVAHSPTTAGLLDRRRLGLLPPGALVVNAARGALVDHDAVVDALVAGTLGGYATDVWDPEPPPAEAMARAADRLLVTPHVAAITDVTYRKICVGAAEAALAALQSTGPRRSP